MIVVFAQLKHGRVNVLLVCVYSHLHKEVYQYGLSSLVVPFRIWFLTLNRWLNSCTQFDHYIAGDNSKHYIVVPCSGYHYCTSSFN